MGAFLSVCCGLCGCDARRVRRLHVTARLIGASIWQNLLMMSAHGAIAPYG